MKNIHVSPTDKPSRLFELSGDLHLHSNLGFDYKRSRNIYITSDEEIKEGDYFIAYSVTIDKKPYISCASEYKERKKEKGKIILTTDQDLIKDGVQAIDDDFLEWFVKNPSCEEVEIKDVYFNGRSYYDANQLSEQEKVLYSSMKEYKIVLPKESQCTCERYNDNTCNYCENKQSKEILESAKINSNKQETLEEAAERFANECNSYDAKLIADGVEFGAKWQQERSYSEEDIAKAIDYGAELGLNNDIGNSFQWKNKKDNYLKQFKKK